MTRNLECTLEQDDRLRKMADGLVSQAACITAAAAELQQAMAGRVSVLQKSAAAPDLYALNEIADGMEKALLAWSCDPKRPIDRGLDVWERETLVNMALDALSAMRRC